MNVNSGTGGWQGELDRFQHMLDTAEVAGRPKRDDELIELRRLIRKHPDEARELLAELEDSARPPSDPLAGRADRPRRGGHHQGETEGDHDVAEE